MKARKVDVIIVGGGLVGLATARLLCQAGFAVVVLDRAPQKKSPLTESYDLRVSAITLGTVKLFKSLGVWEAIEKQRVGKFKQIKIWENHSDCCINFEPAQGFIIENSVMQRALLDKVEILTPVSIKNFNVSKEYITVNLEEGAVIEAKLLIGADGANSDIRQRAELGLSQKSYDQTALVATIHTELPHENIARQRFLSEGPLALLPLSQPNYCSIVWTNSPETTQTLAENSDAEFNSAINKAWGNELGEIRLESQRLSFPLIKRHAKHYVKERIALVGDAAHTIHPLAGQGVNLGFLDAKALAEVLAQAKLENRDIGLMHTLRKYERKRKGDNLIVQKLMDVFNSDVIRKCGVKVVSNVKFLKHIMLNWMSKREMS